MASKTKDSIVFLDSGTIDYKDISFKSLERIGHFKSYSLTQPDQILNRAKKASIVITNKVFLDKETLKKLSHLKCVCVAATGTNNVDLKAAAKQNIAVTNVAGYSTETVVQFTIGFILSLAGKVRELDSACHDGSWSKSKYFTLVPTDIMEVHGKVLGLLGYGTIGKRVASVAESLGMKVLIASIPGRSYKKNARVRRHALEKVLRKSDFLSIHAPLSVQTRNLLNAQKLRLMKPGAHIINMARGGIVDESYVGKMLKSGHLRGAAADVLDREPPRQSHPLLSAPNMILTPHVAWASQEARIRLVSEISRNIEAFQQGKKRNRVV